MPKQKRKKIIAVVLIIYVISIGGSWGYFFYQQDANYDKRVIQQFSPSNPEFSELYKVENRRLVNIAEESYIFPTDRLEYRFTIVNPLEHHIRVAYEFEVFRTGERIHDDSGDWYFQNNDIEHRQFEFSLPDEGRYDLKANWVFYNETNGEKYAQFAPLDRDIQVLSLANKLQGDSNELTFQGLIAASVVGIGTIVALIMNVIFSKLEVDKLDEQNITLIDQFSIQNRPWVSVADVEPRYSLKQSYLEINIKNFGKSPAHNIFAKSFVSDEMVSEDDVDIIPFTPDSYSLAPNEVISIRLIITPDEYKLGHGSGNPLCFGLKLKYTYENDKTGKFILLGTINEGKGFAMTQSKKILE